MCKETKKGGMEDPQSKDLPAEISMALMALEATVENPGVELREALKALSRWDFIFGDFGSMEPDFPWSRAILHGVESGDFGAFAPKNGLDKDLIGGLEVLARAVPDRLDNVLHRTWVGFYTRSMASSN